MASTNHFSACVSSSVAPEKAPTKGGRLGIDAKYSSQRYIRGLQATASIIDAETGEVLTPGNYSPENVRLERYALQSASRKVLKDSTVKRVNNCLRVRQKNADITIYRSIDHKTCSYGGLQTCASVWACPVCAAKISERRKHELSRAIEQHTVNGGEVLLLTLTTPHYHHNKLSEILESQKKALYYFNSGKVASEFNSSIGLIGSIRALEVTHGRLRENNNGWHPHYHILLFAKSGLDLDDLKRSFYDRWLKACIRAKMPSLPDFLHGVSIDNGQKASSYVSKWGLESEMTKGHIKKSNKGETPFDLLRAVLTDNDKQAAALFREFAETFKGKSQLHWSRGLKAKFDLQDVTDETLSEQIDDDAMKLGIIELEDWQLILKLDFRGELLEVAKKGFNSVLEFIGQLKIENINPSPS